MPKEMRKRLKMLIAKKVIKRVLLVSVVVILVCSTAGGAYLWGYNQGAAKGQQEQSAKDNVAYKDVTGRLATASQNNTDLANEYNQLSDKYRILVALTQYAGTTQYQAPTHINCSSTTYGINNQFTDTSCY